MRQNMTEPFPEDDNLFIYELFPHSSLNLVYDFARSGQKRGVQVQMHSSRIQAVFVMFISSTSALRQILMTSQHSSLYSRLVPFRC